MVCATRYVDARFTWPAGEGLRRAVDGERVIPLLSISSVRYAPGHGLRHVNHNICKGEQGSVSIGQY